MVPVFYKRWGFTVFLGSHQWTVFSISHLKVCHSVIWPDKLLKRTDIALATLEHTPLPSVWRRETPWVVTGWMERIEADSEGNHSQSMAATTHLDSGESIECWQRYGRRGLDPWYQEPDILNLRDLAVSEKETDPINDISSWATGTDRQALVTLS